MGVTKGTTFLDENLPVGEYEYYVVAHYEMGCVADSSNHVKVEIEVGIKEKAEGRKQKVEIYPNPTTGELTIEWTSGQVDEWASVEVFDVFGRKLYSCPRSLVHSSTTSIDISHLHPGIYFVRVGFEGGESVKKLVKQ